MKPKLRVLVVDDSTAMRSLIKTILQSNFSIAHIHEAADANQALALTQSVELDLIVTDVAMEPGDGLRLIEGVRRHDDGQKRKLPIIAVTGYSTRAIVERLRDLGVHEVLTKPVTIQALCERVRSVFERPRDFVEGAHYVGPDRRRREENRLGPERRGMLTLRDEIDPADIVVKS